jgi:hypothetical protein
MELWFHPRRYEQSPTLEGLRGDKTPGGSPPPAPAAATTTSALGGQIAASSHSGSAPTNDQGFVGWPSKGSTAASEHAERGMTLGTSDTWPRLRLHSRGTLGHFRDKQE